MNYICIDIGGTSIKYAILTKNAKIVVDGQIPTRTTKDNNFILEDIKKTISQLLEEYGKVNTISGIAISSAGVVDPKLGKIIYAGPTIPNYSNTEIKKEIEKTFNISCEVENDVNCAALGEYYSLENKVENLFCLTIGTGVGGAIIRNGKLDHGFSNTAGEIGYMNIKGTYFQNIASTKFLVEKVMYEKKILDGVEKIYNGQCIFELAKQGDQICIDAIDEMIENLSIGISNIIYILNPQTIIIGGGITAQKEYLEKRIKNAINNKLISDMFKKTEIIIAKQQNQAGIIGALYNFLNKN